MTLREFINKLEKISNSDRNDHMTVMVHVEGYMEQDCYGQGECEEVEGVVIDMFNDCGTFDESTESYDYVKIKA